MLNADLDSPNTVGDFPPVLYRVFDEERWARALVDEGSLRLRLVRDFARLEDDIRADQSEGRAHLLIPGPVQTAHLDRAGNIVQVSTAPGYLNFQGEFANPVYVYCFSDPPDGDLSRLSKFGRFAVRVTEPRLLAQEIAGWLSAEGVLRETPVVEGHRVEYTKGQKAAEPPDHFERTRLSYTQKPPQFAGEYEYRFAVVAEPRNGGRGTAPIDHHVRLGHPLRYAEVLRIEAGSTTR